MKERSSERFESGKVEGQQGRKAKKLKTKG